MGSWAGLDNRGTVLGDAPDACQRFSTYAEERIVYLETSKDA
jgi:hypothetical protein